MVQHEESVKAGRLMLLLSGDPENGRSGENEQQARWDAEQKLKAGRVREANRAEWFFYHRCLEHRYARLSYEHRVRADEIGPPEEATSNG